MQLFYHPYLTENEITFSEAESRHLVKVLRMKTNEELIVTDGKGIKAKGVISFLHEKKTQVQLIEKEQIPLILPQLHLFVACTKNADRIEWMLEKCVEMNLASFTPILTQRGERKTIRIDRLQNIALSAMKQSLKFHLPIIHEVQELSKIDMSKYDQVLVAHCLPSDKQAILAVPLQKSIAVCIGPEGDFTTIEIEKLMANNAIAIDLGESRLRTETAALAACNAVYLKSSM